MESRILVSSFQGITRRQKFLVPMVNSIIRQPAFRRESLSKTANKLGICLRREYRIQVTGIQVRFVLTLDNNLNNSHRNNRRSNFVRLNSK